MKRLIEIAPSRFKWVEGGALTVHDFARPPIECLLSDGDINKLLELIQIHGGNVLEIGSYLGGSAWWMSRVAQNVLCVDDFHGHHGVANQYQVAASNLAKEIDAGKVELFTCNSKYQRDHLERKLNSLVLKRDVAFIDGNHDYEHASNDIDVALRYLRPGGVICGHDFNFEGVNRAVTERFGQPNLLPSYNPDHPADSIWWVVTEEKHAPRATKVRLHMDGCPGDFLVLTAACESIWRDHKQFKFRFGIWDELHRGAPWGCLCEPDLEVRVCYGGAINRSAQTDVRFLPAFYEDLRNKLGLTGHIKTNKPHIYLSPWEMQLPRQVKGDYVVVNAGFKRNQEVKAWGHPNYQDVVDWIREELGLQVVQMGTTNAGDVHRPLRGVIDFIDKTPSFRDLFRLVYYSKFGIGPESFIHHIYASHFHTPNGEKDRPGIPFICVASGWNPKGWASYNTEVYLSRQGQLTCCSGSQGCWRSTMDTCSFPEELEDGERVGRCMKMIQPSEVIRAIRDFYSGGVIA
jgi:predicted O-methyltransferase YrrM